ncbi:MAG: type I glyceraldehyde-3-phosphate dehydrogenase [Candidatus Babeliales bacterium]
MRIAINGFGRIGKNFLRTIMLDPAALHGLDVAVINIGPADKEYVGLFFKYDTIMGHYPGTVEQRGSTLIIDGKSIEIIQELDPLQCPWKKMSIDWVVDCSGKFTTRAGAEKHLKAGAGAVLISAPAKDEDISIVPGVNESLYKKSNHKIVSLGSCTTNAFCTMLKVLHDELTVESGYMTTVHSYTNSQALLDLPMDAKDPRRSRAAALNIVPTSTGAARMVDIIFPELKGKINASAVRVPVGNVSLVDFVFSAKKNASVKQLNDLFMLAATTSLKGIVDVATEPLVSSDFIGDAASVIIDTLSTSANGPLMHVAGWYDNEWGYSSRMKDFLLFIKGMA